MAEFEDIPVRINGKVVAKARGFIDPRYHTNEFKDLPVRVDGEIVGTAKGRVDPMTGDVSDVVIEFDQGMSDKVDRAFSLMTKPGDFGVMEERAADIPDLPNAKFVGIHEHGWFMYELSESIRRENRFAIFTRPGATKVIDPDRPNVEVLKTLGVKSHRDVLEQLGYRWCVDRIYISTLSDDELLKCIEEFNLSQDYASAHPFEEELLNR